MIRTGIAELKAQLSHFLSIARSGEEVVITDRGRPVARLASLEEREADIPGHLVEMERRGEIRIGTGEASRAPDELPRPQTRTGFSVVQTLVEERREGQ